MATRTATPSTAAKKTAAAKTREEAAPDAPETTPPTPNGAEWIFVTPEMAIEMLKKNRVNRDVREKDVRSYARQMRDGTWSVCVEPLVYDTNGNLINGQHRLLAQIQSETSQWWLVLHEVPVVVAKTVNGGARQHLQDILKFNGEPNYILLAGVANNTYLWAHDLLTSGQRPAPLEGEMWLQEHPDLRHSMEIGRQAASVSVIDIGATVMGTCHWIIAQSNGIAEADVFMTRLAYLQNEKPGSAILALLRRLNKGNIDRKKDQLPTRDQIALLIKVWNYDVEGRYIQRIMIRNPSGWENPIALKKDDPITEDELASMPQLPNLAESSVPSDPDMVVDEGEEA